MYKRQTNDTIHARDLLLEHDNLPKSNGGNGHLTLRDLEREHIQRVLGEESGSMGRTAQRLGIARSSLYSKLKTLGIDPPE